MISFSITDNLTLYLSLKKKKKITYQIERALSVL